MHKIKKNFLILCINKNRLIYSNISKYFYYFATLSLEVINNKN